MLWVSSSTYWLTLEEIQEEKHLLPHDRIPNYKFLLQIRLIDHQQESLP